MSKDQLMIKSRAMELFQTGQGADCVIEAVQQIDGQDPEIKEFNVHKYVLMVNSDVFMAMFSHENSKEVREGRIQITDSNGTAVRQMLIYLYTGELSKEYDVDTDAGHLLYIANKYQIQSLVKLIKRHLLKSLSLTNVLDRLEIADLYEIKALSSSCDQFIRRNLEMVKKNAKWLELEQKSPKLALKFFSYSGSSHRGRGGPFALRQRQLSMSKGMNRLPLKNEAGGSQNTWPTQYDEEQSETRPIPKAEFGMMAAVNISQFGKRIQLRENENGHGQAHLAYGNSTNNATQGEENVTPVICNHQDHTGSMVATAKVLRDFAACINNFADNLEQNYGKGDQMASANNNATRPTR